MQPSIQNHIRSVCFIIVLLSAFGSLADAQSAGGPYLWIEFGIGAGSVGEEGAGLNLNAAYQVNKNLFSVRIIGCGELFGRTLNDYSFLYNRVFTSSTLLTSFGCGLGFVTGSISHGLFSDEEPEKIAPVIGLPFEARLFLRPLSFLGLGLFGFANINAEETFYGVTLSLQAGKLR